MKALELKALKKSNPTRIDSSTSYEKSKCLKRINEFPKSKNLRKTLVDYLKNTGLIGCANYVAPDRHPVERYIWASIHVISVISTIFVIIDTTVDFLDNSPVTSVETHRFPIQNVEFPGVSVCTANKISYAAALDFATELAQKRSSRALNLTLYDIMEMLPVLERLYDFDINSKEIKISQKLHNVLRAAFKIYDVNSIMTRLTPKCENIMKHCFWFGKEQFCEDIIFLRKTQDGYCCTFNYVRVTDYFGKTKDQPQFYSSTLHPEAASSSYGLTLVLNPEVDDYYYKMSAMKGFKGWDDRNSINRKTKQILISRPKDYPDSPSGSLTEVFVSPRTEFRLILAATTLYAVKSVRNYKRENRKCLFEDEDVSEFGGYYSYSDCFMYCRVKAMADLCECIPFFYPIPISLGSIKICNLEDLKCLKMHKNKWWKVVPVHVRHDVSDILNETEKSLQRNYLICDCLPSCEDVNYRVKTTRIPLHSSSIRIGRNKNVSIKDSTVLHIYFNKPGSTRLRKDVFVYWYELMSSYGGICGFFLGVSLISVIEFLYFFTVRLFGFSFNSTKKQETTAKQRYFHWKEIDGMRSENKW